MEILGLIFEFIFLSMAVYLYLFAIGKVSSNDESLAQKGAEFRAKNGTWLRILSLAMIAIMLVNIVLHIKQLWME